MPCHLFGSRERSRSRREGEEERIALRVDLDPLMSRAGFADQAPVLGERLGVPLGAELVQKLSRALDVREEKGDGAAREVVAQARSITCRPRDD